MAPRLSVMHCRAFFSAGGFPAVHIALDQGVVQSSTGLYVREWEPVRHWIDMALITAAEVFALIVVIKTK